MPRTSPLQSLLFLVVAALVAPAAPAHAQVDFVLHAELGGALMLSRHQREVLGFDNGLTAMVRPAIRLGDFFDLELQAGGLWFPTTNEPVTQGLGRLFLAGGGLRFEPRLGRHVRLGFDGHVSYVYTGDLSRIGFDAGVIIELQAGDDIGIGPYLRYTHVLASGPNDGADAMMLSYGLSLSFGTARTPPRDTDGDGWIDVADACIDEAAGDHPDGGRPGCPLGDLDHDGVFDDRDVCPRDAAGAQPDREREGCPTVDTDGDGTSDRDDLCPEEPAGRAPDAERRGCPRADADHDGVFDADDVCPTTAAGPTPDPRRDGCPDGDDDGDGALNAADACATEHAGFHPDPDRAGCPLPDQDHDMIPDTTDACPTEPGAPSTNARRHGCPGLVVLHIDAITIEQPVYFATGGDTILPRSRRLLTAIVEAMRLTPEIRRISIEGHTDDVGSEEDNLALSTRRAESVMAWLIEHGVEASRLEAHGHGESRPIADGESRAAREENRRVEFRVLDPALSGTEGGSR